MVLKSVAAEPLFSCASQPEGFLLVTAVSLLLVTPIQGRKHTIERKPCFVLAMNAVEMVCKASLAQLRVCIQ